jgi:DNA invertase Pin-like site-specific DNA recombinase
VTRIRCAIYTRKSSDEGLEQAFNSLEAQRDACEAYIRSQAGEGWRPVRTRYDDGGLSGGTMDRPALQQLLADIRAGQVDTVVVYKVDRLTRSLTDFARIVEVFDAQGVAFVSITQQFSTTTSMGRLTLNMLLTFAQFEREVTAERIRDKIAASKKKGMWMGGPVPLGYDVHDRKLVVNHAEAEVVRRLFALYLEIGSVDRLKQEADRLSLITKRHVGPNGARGGLPFSRGNLYQVLRNPIYVGDISHKGTAYPGQHDGIIDRTTWDAVQQRLGANAPDRRSPTNRTDTSVLAGKAFDETGDRLSPTSAKRYGKRHRYYVSQRLLRSRNRDGTGWRIPAQQLEDAVRHGIVKLLGDRMRLVAAMPALSSSDTRELIQGAEEAAGQLVTAPRDGQDDLLCSLVHRVTLSTTGIHIEVPVQAILKRALGRVTSGDDRDKCISVEVPTKLRRRGVESRLVIAVDGPAAPDERLIALVARSHKWLRRLTSGTAKSVREIAQADGVDEADVSRFLPLAFLTPHVVEAIIGGKHPTEFSAEVLRWACPVPHSWASQRRLLGFSE